MMDVTENQDPLEKEAALLSRRNPERNRREDLMLSMNSYSSVLHPAKYYAVTNYSSAQPLSECNKVIEGVLCSYLVKNCTLPEDTFSHIIEKVASSGSQFRSFLIEVNKYLHTPIPLQFEQKEGPPVYNENIYNDHVYLVNTPEEKDKRDVYKALYFLHGICRDFIALKRLHPETIFSEIRSRRDSGAAGTERSSMASFSSLAAEATARRKEQQYTMYTQLIDAIIGPLEEHMTYEQLTDMITAGVIQKKLSALPAGTLSFEGGRVNMVMEKYFSNLREKYQDIRLCFPFLYNQPSMSAPKSFSEKPPKPIKNTPASSPAGEREEEDPDVLTASPSDVKRGKMPLLVKNNDGTKKYSLNIHMEEYTDYPGYKYKPVPFDLFVACFHRIILCVYILSVLTVIGLIIVYLTTKRDPITELLERLQMNEFFCRFLMVSVPVGVYGPFLSLILFHAQAKETKEYLRDKRALKSLEILLSIWLFSSLAFFYLIYTTSLPFAFVLYTVALLLLVYAMAAVSALRRISWLKNSEETGASVAFGTREIIAEPYLSRNRIRTGMFFKAFYLFVFLLSLALCGVLFYFVSIKRMELVPSVGS